MKNNIDNGKGTCMFLVKLGTKYIKINEDFVLFFVFVC